MKTTTYRIVPEGLISNEAIVKMIVDSKSQEELDVQLTLLGASSLNSRELTKAIKNRTYPVGSSIMIPYLDKLIPFKIFEYRDDGTAYCQSIACLEDNIAFSENDSNDYLTSDIRAHLRSDLFKERFSSDFLDNHLKTGSWEVENFNESQIKTVNDDFVLPDLYELMKLCKYSKDRIRFSLKNAFANSWWLRSLNLATSYTVNTVNAFGAITTNTANNTREVSPACLIG